MKNTMHHKASFDHKIRNYSDRKLLTLCREAGRQTLYWRRKFIGYLPEVYRRGLFEKQGCSSIFEFGKKMAGLSEAQIRLALNLEKRFKDKPALRSALVDGEVSINKLTRVASIATSENDKFLAETAKVLSKSSLEVFVRDVRHRQDRQVEFLRGETVEQRCLGDDDERGGVKCAETKNKNGLFERHNKAKSLPGQPAEAQRRRVWRGGRENGTDLKFQLDPEITKLLNSLHKKGIDVNEILMEMLKKRDVEIVSELERVGKKMRLRENRRKVEGKAASRYVSVQVERVLEKEFGSKCAVPNCQCESEHTHHVLPFSVVGSHDPRFMLPLCRAHHDIVHSVNMKYQENKAVWG